MFWFLTCGAFTFFFSVYLFSQPCWMFQYCTTHKYRVYRVPCLSNRRYRNIYLLPNILATNPIPVTVTKTLFVEFNCFDLKIFAEVVQNGKSMNPSFSEDSVAETTCLKNIKNSDGKSTRSSPPGPTIRISNIRLLYLTLYCIWVLWLCQCCESNASQRYDWLNFELMLFVGWLPNTTPPGPGPFPAS